jgi:hypothetical protein
VPAWPRDWGGLGERSGRAAFPAAGPARSPFLSASDGDEIAEAVAGGDKTAAFLGEQLRPVAEPDAGKLAKLLADLDSDTPETRRSAFEALAGLGPVAEPALRKALEGKP